MRELQQQTDTHYYYLHIHYIHATFNFFEALSDSPFFLTMLFAVRSFCYSTNSNAVAGDPFCSVRIQGVVEEKENEFGSYIYFKKALCTKLSTAPIKIDSNGRRKTSHYMMSLLSVKNLRAKINVSDNLKKFEEKYCLNCL